MHLGKASMIDPTVGLPTITGGGCAYSADLDTLPCGKPSAIHIAVRSPAWGVVSLASCGGHVHIARAAGVVLGEHPHQTVCETTDCWEGVA